MCFEFGSCFGGGRTDDYGGERPNQKEEHVGGRRRRDRTGNHGSTGTYNGGAADHKPEPQAAYHYPPPAADDEAGHKAYHDGARKADLEAPKLPTWRNKVGEDAYTGRLQVQEPAAMDYHGYPTTNTTTALGRY